VNIYHFLGKILIMLYYNGISNLLINERIDDVNDYLDKDKMISTKEEYLVIFFK